MIIPESLKTEYPFSPHYHQVAQHKLHYIDEGNGAPILMLHGNPTWSFYYRNLIKYFKKNYRTIVPDHIGCGLSDKPQDYKYILENHISNTISLIEELNLVGITLILHDWGGAIGMGVATRKPSLIKKIILMNTAAFRSAEIPSRINILKNPLGEWFIRSFNAFAIPATYMAVTKKLPPLLKLGLTLPYHDFNSRIATAKFVLDIPLNKSHISYQTLYDIEKNLSTLQCPILILWGEKDFCFTLNFQKKWSTFFPNAVVKTYPDAGHYLLEDKTNDVINEIDFFLKN